VPATGNAPLLCGPVASGHSRVEVPSLTRAVTPREFKLGRRVAHEEPDVNDMTPGDTPTPASQDIMGEAIIPVALNLFSIVNDLAEPRSSLGVCPPSLQRPRRISRLQPNCFDLAA
jgi:hypothetical protein